MAAAFTALDSSKACHWSRRKASRRALVGEAGKWGKDHVDTSQRARMSWVMDTDDSGTCSYDRDVRVNTKEGFHGTETVEPCRCVALQETRMEAPPQMR